MGSRYPNNRHLAELLLDTNRMIYSLYRRYLTESERADTSDADDDWDGETDDDEDLYWFEETDDDSDADDEFKSDRALLIEVKNMVTNLHEELFGSSPDVPTWDSVEGARKERLRYGIGLSYDDPGYKLSPDEQRRQDAMYLLGNRYKNVVDVQIGKLPNEYELLNEVLERLTEQQVEISRIAEVLDALTERSGRGWWR